MLDCSGHKVFYKIFLHVGKENKNPIIKTNKFLGIEGGGQCIQKAVQSTIIL